jgi:hypothetical protein
MSGSIEYIIASKTRWQKFLFLLFIEVLLAEFLYILVIPLIFWSIYGPSGTSHRIGSLPASVYVGRFAPLLVVLFISACGFHISKRKHDLGTAKSHLLAGLALIVLFLLRTYIFKVPF